MRQTGFTLLEVLVALAIVAFMAVGVSQVIGQRLDIAGVAQSRELAQLCARELNARWARSRRDALDAQLHVGAGGELVGVHVGGQLPGSRGASGLASRRRDGGLRVGGHASTSRGSVIQPRRAEAATV